MSGYRVVVDLERCESNAVCMTVAPTVFDVDEQAVLHVLAERPADSQRADVEAAARLCPRQAIEVVGEHHGREVNR